MEDAQAEEVSEEVSGFASDGKEGGGSNEEEETRRDTPAVTIA